MNKRLKALRKKFAEIEARIKGLENVTPEDMTDEQTEELRSAMADYRTTKEQIDEVVAYLETRDSVVDDDEGDNVSIVVEDAPIYRGTTAAAFGAQLADVAAMQVPDTPASMRTAAKARLEKNTRRAMSLIEKRQGKAPSPDFQDRSFRPLYDEETRAAGTGLNAGVNSEGGFLMQSETSVDLMTNGFNNSEVLSRCQKRTLTGSESMEIVGIDETSRADGSRGGGVRVYTDAELSQITSSTTKFEKIKVTPERLTGLFYASDKVLKNAVFLGQEMRQLFVEEFAFKTQDLVMEGSGAGQALGIKAADCQVSVAKETGQAAATIVAENVEKMFMRLLIRGNDNNVAWFANRDCFQQLMSMSKSVGTGGAMANYYVPARRPGDRGSILGYPVIFIEQCETLGTEGDIWLTDFSQYVVADYGDINEASSIHFKFDYGQTSFRFIYYFDGQPRLVSAITPYKGSNTLSPFVNLAVRS